MTINIKDDLTLPKIWVPEHFLCRLSYTLMTEPVATVEGYIYDV